MTVGQAASALHLGVGTVKTHLRRLHRKLGVKRRAALVAALLRGVPGGSARSAGERSKSTERRR